MAAQLAGATIVIGRPAGAAERWRRAFEAQGATVAQQPALRIEAHPPGAEALASLEQFGAGDCAVFASRPAVEHGLRLPGIIDRLRRGTCWAVGRQTAKALIGAGLKNVRSPGQGFGADALLADPDFPAARRVWLFAAEGGRTVIADSLAHSQTTCNWVYVYQRLPADIEPRAQSILNNASGPIVIIASSVVVLEQLLTMYPEALRQARVVSLGPRITKVASEGNFSKIVTAHQPDLPSILEATRLAI